MLMMTWRNHEAFKGLSVYEVFINDRFGEGALPRKILFFFIFFNKVFLLLF